MQQKHQRWASVAFVAVFLVVIVSNHYVGLASDPVVVIWLMVAGGVIAGPLGWYLGRRKLRAEILAARVKAHEMRQARVVRAQAKANPERTRVMRPVAVPEQTQFVVRDGKIVD